MLQTAKLDLDISKTLYIGEVAFSYYNVQRAQPNEQDYLNWISLLSGNTRATYQARGFQECLNVLSFRKYFLEIREEEMKQYMKERLQPEDYQLWLDMRQTS